jgi:type II secretory pathway component PulF
MLRFEYQAIAPDGSFLDGEVYSENSEAAALELQSRGLDVQRIGPGTIPTWIETIDQCLGQREAIIRCLEDWRSQSWLRSDSQLTNLICRLRSGAGANQFVTDRELAPFLPLVLLFAPNRDTTTELNDWIQSYLKQSNRQRLIWKLISYPVIVPLIYLTILVVISFTIVPQFRRMFDEFELRLPAPTLRLLWISEQISEYPLRTMIGCVAIAGAAVGLVVAIRILLDHSQETPFLGHFSRSSKRQLIGMSRLTGTLAELLRIETPLPEAIRIAGLSSGYRYFREEAMSAAYALDSAVQFGIRVIPRCFPATLIFAMQAGPDKQPSIELIQQLSKIYMERLEHRAKFAESFVAPAMTIAMAWLIGGIVSALMLPLFSLITSLSG